MDSYSCVVSEYPLLGRSGHPAGFTSGSTGFFAKNWDICNTVLQTFPSSCILKLMQGKTYMLRLIQWWVVASNIVCALVFLDSGVSVIQALLLLRCIFLLAPQGGLVVVLYLSRDV